jgi:hypothetical protein
VVVDTSSDDSEFVEQNEIQDHVPLKHCTLTSQQVVPWVRAAEALPFAGELTSPSAVTFSHPHQSAADDLCHPRRAEAIIDRPSSSAMEWRQGRARPTAMEWRHHHLAAALEGRPHPQGGVLGGPPPSSTGGGNRATSLSVSSCNMAPGAPWTKK